jgi:hypothetical protein
MDADNGFGLQSQGILLHFLSFFSTMILLSRSNPLHQ